MLGHRWQESNLRLASDMSRGRQSIVASEKITNTSILLIILNLFNLYNNCFQLVYGECSPHKRHGQTSHRRFEYLAYVYYPAVTDYRRHCLNIIIIQLSKSFTTSFCRGSQIRTDDVFRRPDMNRIA